MEHWLPLLYPNLETLFDYLPDDASVFLDNQAEAARGERWALAKDAYEARREASLAKGGAAIAPCRRSGSIFLRATGTARWRAATSAV